MDKIFDFDWLNDIEEVYTDTITNEPMITIPQLNHPIRFGTASYGGYIVTIKDLDSDEEISFNCGRMDIESDHIDETYLFMRNKFSIMSNGVPFKRKNVRLMSVTVPQEKYEEVMEKCRVNGSLLWRIWYKYKNDDRSMI